MYTHLSVSCSEFLFSSKDEDSQLKAIDFGLSYFVKLGWSSKLQVEVRWAVEETTKMSLMTKGYFHNLLDMLLDTTHMCHFNCVYELDPIQIPLWNSSRTLCVSDTWQRSGTNDLFTLLVTNLKSRLLPKIRQILPCIWFNPKITPVKTSTYIQLTASIRKQTIQQFCSPTTVKYQSSY
ncbi:CDPK-related kinase 8 [Prunus dulcis]|uniref:CDPK-related kinase 8 n=1 Tax=Prunus dulcis TaxID=3755 RepID=A0A4Y1RSZ6_PRUDU|nr:CDPK-related kinase 8 [Prunus dulcis]